MNTFRKTIYITLLLAISLVLPGQTVQIPKGGTPKGFTLPQTNSFRLDNGLSVTLVPYGNLPKVSVRLVIRSGNLNEAADQVWLADLTGNYLKEGTSSRTSEQISEEAAAMGGSVDVVTGIELTSVSGDVLSEFAPELIDLIADIALNPSFPDSEADRLKNDMLRDLNIQLTQPSNIAFALFSRVLYPDHPYGRVFPDQTIIKSFDTDKVRSFYNENFGAVRSHIYVSGVFDEKLVEKAIRESFGEWKKGAEPLINIPVTKVKNSIFITDRPGSPQAVLNIGLPVIDPSKEDYMALLLTNSLLGGSFTSRITMNIREDKGYTYSPYSQVSARYRTAYWMQYAEVATESTAPALKEIFYEIDRLRNEPVTSEELEGIKNYMSGIFVLQNSTRQGIIGQLVFLDLHGLDISFLTNYISNIQAVTIEDVQNIMNKYLKKSDMTIVVVGDKKKIEKSLAPFGSIQAL